MKHLQQLVNVGEQGKILTAIPQEGGLKPYEPFRVVQAGIDSYGYSTGRWIETARMDNRIITYLYSDGYSTERWIETGFITKFTKTHENSDGYSTRRWIETLVC